MSGPNTESVIRNGSTRLCKQPRLAESPLGRGRWGHGPRLLETSIDRVERRLPWYSHESQSEEARAATSRVNQQTVRPIDEPELFQERLHHYFRQPADLSFNTLSNISLISGIDN
jgi:hypothetical protein